MKGLSEIFTLNYIEKKKWKLFCLNIMTRQKDES